MNTKNGKKYSKTKRTKNMKVRIEIDEVNGRVFTKDIHNSNCEWMKEILLKIRKAEKIGLVTTW